MSMDTTPDMELTNPGRQEIRLRQLCDLLSAPPAVPGSQNIFSLLTLTTQLLGQMQGDISAIKTYIESHPWVPPGP